MSMPWWRRLLMALSGVTGIALAWNHWGMERRLVIDAGTRLPVHVSDDRDSDGGDSQGRLERDARSLRMACRIGTRYQYPFCEMQFELGVPPRGQDLSRYDTIELSLAARSERGDTPVRVFIRNFNPRYSQATDGSSLKVHEIAFTPAQYPGGLGFPLDRIVVASWWVDEHPLPLELSGHELSNAISLSVATAGKVQPGVHTIEVERIVLRGKWISAGNLGLVLVAMWVGSVLAFLLLDSLAARRRLRRSAQLRASLQRLNQTLRSQTESLAQQARHDALSGALNRHGLTEALLGQARQSEASLFPASLVFIDIDHFKRINDTLGHAVGDQVIHRLADLVRNHVQRGDLLVRWGGEEFLLLCQQTPCEAAVRVAERLRKEVTEATWPQGLSLSCSFGVSEWQRGQELDEAIRRADAAMYQAKRDGRDRVTCADAAGAVSSSAR